jgi:PGF-pre-PGF domain-containing protein
MRGRVVTTFSLVLVITLVSSPLTAALHSSEISLDPITALENSVVIYTLTIANNLGYPDSIDNVALTIPVGFVVENENEGLPAGWSAERKGPTIIYTTATDRILPGESENFSFKVVTPNLPEPVAQPYDWSVITTDNAGFSSSHEISSLITPAEILMVEDNAFSDDNDNLLDWLVISVGLRILTPEGQYWLEGELYENSTGYYLTSATYDTWGDYPEGVPAGTVVFHLMFDSGAIYNSSLNDRVRVVLRLRDMDWNEIDNFVHVSGQTYVWENFEPPDAVFADTTSHFESTVDLDNDDYYDYLSIHKKISVREPGTYVVTGSLYENGEFWWENYICWGESGTLVFDNADNYWVEVKFAGKEIRKAGLSGHYLATLAIYKVFEGEWIFLDMNDENYYVTENSYSWENFEPPALLLNSLTAQLEDTNGNGKAEFMVALVQVTVSDSGSYRFNGSVYDNKTDDWITWEENEVFLDVGSETVALRFDGAVIRGFGSETGYYRISVNAWDLEWNWMGWIENVVGKYLPENFEPPEVEITSIKDNVIDEDGDNYFDWLKVSVGLSVRKAGEYSLDGTLRGPAGEYISWEWAPSTYLETGEHEVELWFSGIDIRREKVNGPYTVEVEVRDWDWNFVDRAENSTKAYEWENFEPLGAEILEVFDAVEDTDGDSFYNYLVVSVRIQVREPGNYRLSGNLYENSKGWWDWFMWGKSKRVSFESPGVYIENFRFDGARIRSKRVSAYYKAEVRLYNDEWERLSELENVVGYFNWENFERPPIELFAIRENAVDGPDSDNYYDYLEIALEFRVEAPGWYYACAELAKEWRWIAWAWGENELSETDNVIRLRFPGEAIYSSGENGPYKLWIWVGDGFWASYENTTQAYSYENFQRPPAIIAETGHSDEGLDTDNDNLFNFLVVGVRVEVREAGEYRLYGCLYDTSWRFIDWADNRVHLSEGTETVELRFEGYKIRDAGEPAPYRVELYLDKIEEEYGYWFWFRDMDSHTYLTSENYLPENFDGPPIEFASITYDFAEDTDGDGYYDYLVVEAGVLVSENGSYRLSGYLQKPAPSYAWLGWADNEFYLEASENVQYVQLRFKGRDISRTGENGPYEAQLRLSGTMEEWWSWFDRTSHQTSAYSASSFEPVPVKFTPPHSDYGLDVDGDNLYDFLVVKAEVDVREAGRYVIAGYLSNAGFVMEEMNLAAGKQTVELKFAGWKLRESASDGPYRVYLWAMDEDWSWLDSDEHETSRYSHLEFDPARVKLAKSGWRVAISDSPVNLDPDNDNLYDFVEIQVSLEVRENGKYRVCAALLAPWREERPITEWAENTVDLTTDDNSVTLRFSGYSVVKRRLTSRLYLGIIVTDMKGNWLDEGWADTSNVYSYTEFENTKIGHFAIVAKDLGRVSAGESATANFENTELTMLTEVELKTKGEMTSAIVDVKEHEIPPPGAKDVEGEGLSYMEITVTEAQDVEEAIIRFRVRKQTVEELGLDVNSIKLYRENYESGEWFELETWLENEDDEYYYFAARSPGFSFFVILGKLVEEEKVQPTYIAPTPTPATFEFSAFYIPDVIRIGEKAIISFTITNTGDLAGSYTIILSLDNVILENREITLEAGESREVSFEIIPPAIGTFVIQIAGQTAELQVEPEITIVQENLIAISVPPIYVDEIAVDLPAVVEITQTSIEQITIAVWEEVRGVIIKVKELIDKPPELPTPEGVVYTYLEILAEKLPNESISSASINFRVSLAWLESENIAENTITLSRYHEGTWEALKTEKYDEDENYLYFTATTPGFSIFAISGERVEVVGPPPAVTPTLPTQPFAPTPPLHLIVVVAIVLMGIVIAIIWRYISVGTRELRQE